MMYATDWTYDLFMEDASLYKATPRKGIHCRKNASYRECFMRWFKNRARDFETEWNAAHAYRYDRTDGWIGDTFAKTLDDCFSDFYKDAYGQRPHLPAWFYVQAVGLPMSEDTARTFCASPVNDAIESAKQARSMIG